MFKRIKFIVYFYYNVLLDAELCDAVVERRTREEGRAENK